MGTPKKPIELGKIKNMEKPDQVAILPLSAYADSGIPYGNFWVRFVTLVILLIRDCTVNVMMWIISLVIGGILSANLVGHILFWIRVVLLAIPIYFLLLTGLVAISYQFGGKAHLFPGGHPYKDQNLMTITLGDALFKEGVGNPQSRYDLEITLRVQKKRRRERFPVWFLYRLNYYGEPQPLNLFYLPHQKGLQDGGLLRIRRLGLPFIHPYKVNVDHGDVYIRVNFVRPSVDILRLMLLLLTFAVIGVVYALLMIWLFG